MIKIQRYTFVLFACLFLLTGCGDKKKSPADALQNPSYPVTCFGILPSVSGVDKESVVSPEKEKALRLGLMTMDRILAQELSGLEKIKYVGVDQIAGLQMTGGENPLEFARLVGASIGCNAILETTVRKYTDRIGGKYSAESPAVVAFDFRLIGTDSASVLWSAQFDEEQVSVLENIYEWGKANTRGFSWITAEELMREGVKEKFAGSTYFKKKNTQDNLGSYEDKI